MRPGLSARGTTLVSGPEDDLVALRARLAEREREVARLEAALAENELLLSELGHRAGNNLQAIIALIRFAARAIPDPDSRRRVEELAERVAKIGLIQRLLAEAGHKPGIEADFLGEIAEAVRATYGADEVELRLALEPVALKPSAAVALGLLVNEAMSNAFKHAVAGVDRPRIDLSLRTTEGAVELVVQDNGPGPGPAREGSMGLQLMQTLARQMQGTIAIENRFGTRVLVSVPLKAVASRQAASAPVPDTMPPLAPDPSLSAASR